MFAIQVEYAVSAMESGVILKGSCDLTKYQIEPGTCLYDLAANEYIVSTVTLTEDSQVEILISDTKGKPADYFTGRVLTTLADVCILFQQSKSDLSLPDESFAEEVEEYNRVKELLYDLPFGESPPTILIDIEALKNGLPCTGQMPTSERPVRAIFRGASLSCEEYRRLYDELAEKGVFLANTPKQYSYCKLHTEVISSECGCCFTEKYRTFFAVDKPLCTSGSGEISKEDQSLLCDIAMKIPAGLFNLDIGRKPDGTLSVLGIGDGQTAGLDDIEPKDYIIRLTDLLYELHNPDNQEPYTYFNIRTLYTATTEFKLPTGDITITNSKGEPVPFSVRRSYGHFQHRVMDAEETLIIQYLDCDDDYVITLDCCDLVIGEEYSLRFSGNLEYSHGTADEHCSSFCGISGDYAVALGTDDFNDDVWIDGGELYFYEVEESRAVNGYKFRLLEKARDKIFFRVAWLKADTYPDEALYAVLYWTC